MFYVKAALSVLVLLSLCNCANFLKYVPQARTVKKQHQRGGVVALDLQHRPEDRELADSMMQENCGSKRVSVVEETEVIVGSVTTASAENENATKRKVGSVFGVDVESGHEGRVNTSSETTQKKEWQITYGCRP